MLRNILYVGIGGSVGSILRYLLSVFCIQHGVPLPFATLGVNILGCLCIGGMMGYLTQLGEPYHSLRYLIVVGFCGGFTTFSTFAWENYQWLISGQYGLAILYTLLNVVFCILSVWIGFYLYSTTLLH